MSQYALACCYDNGLGVDKNDVEAFLCYVRSAKNGNTAATFAAAQCYEEGRGTTRSMFEAAALYLKLFLDGDGRAAAKLRDIYRAGEMSRSHIPSVYRSEHLKKRTQDVVNSGKKLFSFPYYVTDDVRVLAEEIFARRIVLERNIISALGKASWKALWKKVLGMNRRLNKRTSSFFSRHRAKSFHL